MQNQITAESKRVTHVRGLLLCFIGLALSAGLSLHWIMRLEKQCKTRVWSHVKALSLSPSLEYFIWKLLYFPILVVFKAGSEALPLDGLSREAKVLSRQTSLPPTHPHPKNSRQTDFSTNKKYPLHSRKKKHSQNITYGFRRRSRIFNSVEKYNCTQNQCL